MCWNEPVSWITFALGTIFNIFNICYFKDKYLTTVSILIQWLLLMQLFEAILWRNQKECNKTNKFATNGAMIANLTQPIILCLIFLAITDVNIYYKSAAVTICMIYICYILYSLNQKGGYNCILVKEDKSCSHINLFWWKNINGFVYVITLFALILLLIRPMKFALVVGGYILFSLIFSMLFYSCSVGSLWCWFVSFAPIVFGLYYYFTKK